MKKYQPEAVYKACAGLTYTGTRFSQFDWQFLTGFICLIYVQKPMKNVDNVKIS